ncbi:MAG: RNase adapter RapZ [Lachnospiraceae bacterium]|nr:RNase adapter RapZ [Lachnospiraceae bacterium]MBQ2407567.1 RNase adapter RapZ [Lachnospiraceae bacterium]MBQ5849240.1 RNase adapter RapZ [Lachnospiraceae bacterium]MEE0919938.1 RNase adapter RapZ [Lachnospiraceae bacterium]
MRFVIVTGMSGGGKATAMKMLEDAGFYCADNMPVPLIEKFVELLAMPENGIDKVALGLDVRADQSLDDVSNVLTKLRESKYNEQYHFEILFLEASNQVLLKRYKETRRMHPLSADGDLMSGINSERQRLESIKSLADYVIDTSNLLTRELKAELDRIFINNLNYNSLMVNVMSFGFKYGIPQDADLVFDVRFLPNPFYIDDLKQKTGLDKEVQDYVMSYDEAHKFLDKLEDMIRFLIPNYVNEGKYQLVIAIGCTGGQHRSVTLAGELYKRLKDGGDYGLTLRHRDTK